MPLEQRPASGSVCVSDVASALSPATPLQRTATWKCRTRAGNRPKCGRKRERLRLTQRWRKHSWLLFVCDERHRRLQALLQTWRRRPYRPLWVSGVRFQYFQQDLKISANLFWYMLLLFLCYSMSLIVFLYSLEKLFRDCFVKWAIIRQYELVMRNTSMNIVKYRNPHAVQLWKPKFKL